MNFQTSGTLTQRSILQEEISNIRTRVSKLKEIQSQMKVVNGLVKSHEQKSQKSFKKIGDFEKEKQTTNNRNHKVKVYELQKKLDFKNKQQKDKHTAYIRKLLQQEKLLEEITTFDQLIHNEKQKSEELYHLNANMEEDLKVIEGKAEEIQKLVEQEKSILNIYKEEQIAKIQNIKMMKKSLKMSSQQTEADESLIMSEEAEDEDESRQNQDDSVLQTKKINNMMKEENELHKFGANKPTCMFTFTELGNGKKLKEYSIEELQEILAKVEESVAVGREKQLKWINNLGLLKKHNKNIEASTKHTRTTKNLLFNQVTNLNQRIHQFQMELFNSVEQCEGMSQRLSKKEGQRGSMRGKLGVKVQNNRLIGMINEQLEMDLHNLTNYTNVLKMIYSEGKDIIGSLIKNQEDLSGSQSSIQV